MAVIRTWYIRSAFFAAIAACPAIGHGMLVPLSHDGSVKEIVPRVQAWIQAHPEDPAGYVVLGRIHALAWAYGDKIPLVFDGDATRLPSFNNISSTVLVTRGGPVEAYWQGHTVAGNNVAGNNEDRKRRPVTAEDARHLVAAIAQYRKAIELTPDDALSQLALAWMLAEEGRYALELPADLFPDPKATDAEKAAWKRAFQQLSDADPHVRDAGSKALLDAMPRCFLFVRNTRTDDPETQARVERLIQDYFELQALDHYRQAFALKANEDLKAQPSVQADALISESAGSQLVTLLARHPDAAKKGEVKLVQEILDPLEKKKMESRDFIW